MKNVKKLLSILLACCMVVSMLPAIALAEETGETMEKSETVYTDQTDWILSGVARYDEKEQCFVLTEEEEWQTGAIWYRTSVSGDFTLEFDYYTGVSTTALGGADGIAVAFYADFLYTMDGGEQLGFNGSGGYGLELDTYYNRYRGDPTYNHIALIDGDVGKHLEYASLAESEDNDWHHLKIQVKDNEFSAYVDSIEKITYVLEKTDFEVSYLGITSATGTGYNYHKVKNIQLSIEDKSGSGEGDEPGNLMATNFFSKLLDDDCGVVIDGVSYDYKYQLSAVIYNGMSLTAANSTATLDVSGATISLDEDTPETVLLGDIESGGSHEVSWIVYAARPENTTTVTYGVTTRVDGALTFRQMSYFDLKGSKDNTLKDSDLWCFNNNGFYYGDSYYISGSDYNRLIENLSNVDVRNVTWTYDFTENYNGSNFGYITVLHQLNIDNAFAPEEVVPWNGSCYGMSAWVCLVKAGVLTPSLIQSGEDTLNELENPLIGGSPWGEISAGTQSAINYYHFQQKLQNNIGAVNAYECLDQKMQLGILENLVDEIPNGGAPVLLGYQWYPDLKSDGSLDTNNGEAHAVVAYGVERGKWTVSNITWNVLPGWNVPVGSRFDRRILIYDCAVPDGGEDYYLYYSTETGIWCIPGREIISTDSRTADSIHNNGMLAIATNDISLINSVDYQTGEVSSSVEHEYTTISTAFDGFWILRTGGADYEISGFSTMSSTDGKSLNIVMDANITTEGEGTSGTATVILPNMNERYTVEAEEDMVFSAVYADYFEAAAVSGGGAVTFHPDGAVSFQTDSASDYYLTITANEGHYTLPWHTIEAMGTDSAVSMELTENGVMLSGNSLTNVTVYGTNDDETVEVAFSTDEKEVLIANNDVKDTLVIMIDSDEDGDFETILNTTEEPNYCTITFDANGGTVSINNMTTRIDGTLLNLPIPTRGGYIFNGWYTASSDGEKVTTNTVFSTDTTVYAQWTDIGGSSSGSNSSGGSFGNSSSNSANYSVFISSEIENGTVTVDSSEVRKGTAVTITVTPDAGYELDSLTVTDKYSNGIEATDNDDGTYSFTMPGSDVSVNASFTQVKIEMLFADVAGNAYYAEAVRWAIESGITEGTSTTTFSPDADCTRAQIVTFLYRTAGSPEPSSTSNPFTDVNSGDYYYKAVLWAVENGITVGTSTSTFSPDAVCTRGQSVTFLYRYDGSPEVSGTNPFTDVVAGTYYADTVQWAVNEGITAGTSATTFSPDADCTRAQIITFLWRYMGK